MGPIPTQLMPMTDTAPISGVVVTRVHARQPATPSGLPERPHTLAMTAELPIVEDGQ